MSNLSDIGFPVKSEEDVNQILMDVLPFIDQVPCPPFGFYYTYRDRSGAELFLQATPDQDLVGFNPAFDGRFFAAAELLRAIERDTSPLDGGFVAKLGDSIVVFDLPDFRTAAGRELPTHAEIALTAFASSGLKHERGTGSDDLALSPLHGDAVSLTEPIEDELPPQAHVRIRAVLKDSQLRENSRTGSRFYVCGIAVGDVELDVVVDPALLKEEPLEGDVFEGSFWLSGKVRDWVS